MKSGYNRALAATRQMGEVSSELSESSSKADYELGRDAYAEEKKFKEAQETMSMRMGVGRLLSKALPFALKAAGVGRLLSKALPFALKAAGVGLGPIGMAVAAGGASLLAQQAAIKSSKSDIRGKKTKFYKTARRESLSGARGKSLGYSVSDAIAAWQIFEAGVLNKFSDTSGLDWSRKGVGR